MKEKLIAITDLFQAIAVFFVLTLLQIWYILTGDE